MQPRSIMMLVFATVLAWGAYLAIGAYLYNNDPRRGLIVLGSFALFLGFWALMLGFRARRMRQTSESNEDDTPDDRLNDE